MAQFYDRAMQRVEQSCLANWRRELLSNLKGNVLEVGCGTGVNLTYYPDSVNKLVLTDPEPHMLKVLKEKNGKLKRNYQTKTCSADALEFPENSFDAVVSTLVLCSVGSVHSSLCEIRRVLKPEAKLLFIEHVMDKDHSTVMKWQKRIQPFWSCISGNCHLARDTETSISHAGFTFESIEKSPFIDAPFFVSPIIKGIAISTKQ